MSHVLDIHIKRSTFHGIGHSTEIQAACNAGFNASPQESPPVEICEVPLLHEWFVIGQRAASYIDHVKS